MSETLLQIIEAFKEWARALTESLRDGRITVAQWYIGMERIITRAHIAAMIEGLGTSQIPPQMLETIKKNVNNQLGYLENFRDVIENSPDFVNGWVNRASSYGASSKVSYWEGKIVDMTGRALPLPAMPAQGTQCLCITTPHSRVFTDRGYVPISEVKPGDWVLTHRMRWQPVLRTFVREPKDFDRQAYIILPDGTKIGCTADHRWLTDTGWQTSKYIDSQGKMIYNIPYEYLQRMWNNFRKSEYKWALHSMPLNMRMWEEEGLSGGLLSLLQQQHHGENTMGQSRTEGNYFGGDTGSGRESEDSIRGLASHGIELVSKNGGRPLREAVFRREWGNETHLPLPACLDIGEWANTKGVSYPSQERRLHGRQNREFRTTAWFRPSFPAHDRGACSQDAGSQKYKVFGHSATQSETRMGMSELRENFYELPQEWHRRPQILFTGLLQSGTLLYDLEVAEDHSFILEGVITHNSNCLCEWDIKELDKEAGNYNCFWRRHSSDSCQTCRERESQWNPVRIRNMMLM